MAQPVKQIINPWNYFSKELTKLISYITKDVAPMFGITEITPEIFIFSALESNDCMLYKALNSYLTTIDISKIHDEIGSKLIKNDGIVGGKVDFSKSMVTLLNIAYSEKNNTNSEFITSDHILLSILVSQFGSQTISQLFLNFGVSYNIMLDLSKKVHDVISSDVPTIANSMPEMKIIRVEGSNDILKEMFGGEIPENIKKKQPQVEYCTNLNQLAIDGKIDDLIGRDDEINKVFTVLSRRKCNNVILVGKQGVGKTQCVYGLAKRIVEKNVPIQFMNNEIWKLNPGEMMAGTQLRGMFEDRIVGLIKQLKNKKNIILFIDDLDTLFGSKHSSSTDYDSGGLLNEILSGGDVKVIATASFKGYKSIIDSNYDIAKKFQDITIDPLSKEECMDMLIKSKEYYETFHNVKYSDEIIYNSVELSNKYISDKCLPSSAIDIIDEVGAYKRINSFYNFRAKQLGEEISYLENEKNRLIKMDKIDECNEIDFKLSELRNSLAKIISDINKHGKDNITMDDLYTTVSNHTGIPLSKISKSEKDTLKQINNILKNKIIGQDEAIDVVSRAIKRNKIGLSNSNRPRLSIFACGPTGCGKTLLAKTLAKEIFGDEKYLVRFDMSEYSDETSVNKLIGSAAGYIGYNEGGLLTEAIKNKKYCVLLIDEIEKANEKVYNLLLQVLDEGFLTDNTGQKVDFRNTIVILTSNVGAKRASVEKPIGFTIDDNSNTLDVIKKEMKNKFPPEFLNRLDDIVYFNKLTDDNLKSIIRLELDYLGRRINKIGFSIKHDEKVVENLFKIISEEKEYGARPIHRAIRDKIENQITDLIIDNDYESHEFNITCEEDKIKIE